MTLVVVLSTLLVAALVLAIGANVKTTERRLLYRPRRLYTVDWPEAAPPGPGNGARPGPAIPAGRATIAGFEGDLFREYEHGNLPRFGTGIGLAQRDDDGSEAFARAFGGATGRATR